MNDTYAVVSISLKHLGRVYVVGCILYVSVNKAECDRITGTLRNKECKKRVAEQVYLTHHYVGGVRQF